MTLLFADGCLGGDLAVGKWDSGSSGTLTTTSPRFTGGAYFTAAVLYKTIPVSTEVFASGAFWFPAGNNTVLAFYGDAGATEHLAIVRNSSNHLELRLASSGGTVLATGAATIPIVTWAHIEARVVINDTTGIVQIRINGNTTPDINFSGDTKNGGTNSSIDKVAWVATNSSCKVTDCAVTNTSGSLNNTWLGNTTIATLVPNAVGTYNEGDASPTTTTALRYTLVNDLPFNSNSSSGIFVYGSSGGSLTRDTWQFTDTPYGTDSIKALQLNQSVEGSGGGTMPVKRMIRIGSTNYLGPSFTPTYAVFATFSEIVETSPATSAAWTVTAVDGIEAGITGLTGSFDALIRAMSIEVLIDAFPTVNDVKVLGGGTITVDTPNNVQVNGGGTVLVRLVGQTGGAIVLNGGGTIVVASITTDFPQPAPTDPTLDTPYANEVAITIVAETFPEPTLVDGIPVDWNPS